MALNDVYVEVASVGIQGLGAGSGATGIVGPAGATGVAGVPGSQGDNGATGAQGASGATGPIGPAGTSITIVGSAPNSSALNPSYVGNIGDAYITEDTGHIWLWNGTQWIDGGNIVGPTGLTGATGIAGASGSQGQSGQSGQSGATGATGVQGASGINGSTGPQGIAGASGSQGQMGASGATGTQGASGINGSTGPQGIAGATGATGHIGATGTQGASGINGSTGPQGIAGASGSQGQSGASGATGTQGVQGASGASGSQGVAGPIGASGIAEKIVVSNITGATGGATGSITNEFTDVTKLRFDADTGFNVSGLAPGEVKISLGSAFKTIQVPGQSDLVAIAEDTLEIIPGSGISITTNPSANPKALTITATGLQPNIVNISGTNQAVVETVDSTLYRSSKYDMQVTAGSYYMTTELRLLIDGPNVFLTEYGTIGDYVGTFDTYYSPVNNSYSSPNINNNGLSVWNATNLRFYTTNNAVILALLSAKVGDTLTLNGSINVTLASAFIQTNTGILDATTTVSRSPALLINSVAWTGTGLIELRFTPNYSLTTLKYIRTTIEN